MIPEIDVQLGAIAKSLADNVMPIVMESGDAMAIEQLHLCLATLGIVKQRLPDLHAALRCDLIDNLALLTEIAPDDSAMVADAETMLETSRYSAQQIETQVRIVKERIAALLNEARGSAREAAIRKSIMAAEGVMIERKRAWAAPMGFEPDPTQVTELEQLIEKGT